MRYRKGSITLSETQDHPLLRQVLDSGVVAHNQLFEFMQLDYCASSRNSFNNRVRRLVAHGLLRRYDQLLVNHDVVYSISECGALELSGKGEYCARSVRRIDSPRVRSDLYHSLELNEVHLSLKRTRSLVYWMSEVEIRSRNELTMSGYWKNYDAVAVVRIAGQDCKFALEYERTPKSSQQYTSIRERIEQETAVAHFLYLVPNYDLLSFLAGKFAQCKRAVYIGLFGEFRHQTLFTLVRRCGSPASVQFASIFGSGKQGHRPGVLFPGIAM